MKKIIVLTICLAAVTMLFGCGSDKQTLKVYNAGEYIDTALISDFEAENNCKVIYETFDSNESMYTKVMSGESYDVIIPSDYMIERLSKENLLCEIDKSKLENYDTIMPGVLSQPFDEENKYSIPYFWGSVGILYDETQVDAEDLKAGWDILKNPKYKENIYMYDSERDSFMIALKALGYSLNTANKAELDAAYNWLIEQNEIMSPVYVGDEVIDSMISGNKAMAIVYSGDATYIMSENENMKYLEPDNGTNLWIDGMVIMKNSQNAELAHKFIDFMIKPENAFKNSEMVGYTSPVEPVFEKLRETTFDGNDAYVPRQGYDKDEFFRYQDAETKKYCAELWTKVKSQ